jgi:hypothetical protein
MLNGFQPSQLSSIRSLTPAEMNLVSGGEIIGTGPHGEVKFDTRLAQATGAAMMKFCAWLVSPFYR